MIYIANVIGDDLIDEEREVGSTPLIVGDEGLVVQNGDREGVTVLLAAADIEDAERRILATWTDGFIDCIDTCVSGSTDWKRADPTLDTGLQNIAHAVRQCDDPDCKIHHPEVIEDESRLTAMAWYEAGRRSCTPFG